MWLAPTYFFFSEQDSYSARIQDKDTKIKMRKKKKKKKENARQNLAKQSEQQMKINYLLITFIKGFI